MKTRSHTKEHPTPNSHSTCRSWWCSDISSWCPAELSVAHRCHGVCIRTARSSSMKTTPRRETRHRRTFFQVCEWFEARFALAACRRFGDSLATATLASVFYRDVGYCIDSEGFCVMLDGRWVWWTYRKSHDHRWYENWWDNCCWWYRVVGVTRRILRLTFFFSLEINIYR